MTTGRRLFCEEFLCFNAMPSRHICPYLCTSEKAPLLPPLATTTTTAAAVAAAAAAAARTETGTGTGTGTGMRNGEGSDVCIYIYIYTQRSIGSYFKNRLLLV